MIRSSRFSPRVLFPLYGGCILLVLLGAVTAQGATYYVATTGSDANPGTSDRPWRNPQNCVDANSPLVAGDICEVANGTYRSTTTGRVVLVDSASPSGQAGSPITIKSTNSLGATIEIPNSWPGSNCDASSCPFSAFYITKPYYVIEGFQITRPGSYFATNAAVIGVVLEPGNNAIIRRNHFHDIARTVCHNGLLGNAGVYLRNSTNVTIEYNKFNTIGRLRNGENGCSTDKFQQDHGVYADATTDLTIRRNVFYDVNRGMPLNIKAYSGATTRLKVYNNTISGKTPTADTQPGGQIALTNIFNDVQIKNNIFYDPSDGYVIWGWTGSSPPTTVTNVVIDHNLTNGTRANFINPNATPASGSYTYTNNLTSTSPGFVDAAGRDYRLAADSAARNAGVNVGLQFNGSAPDIGAYEFSEQDGFAPLRPVGLRVQ